jgi:hypothetical protein
MNISAKLGYAKTAVESIARHDDEDPKVREAALRHLVAVIVYETQQAHERHARRIAVRAAEFEKEPA